MPSADGSMCFSINIDNKKALAELDKVEAKIGDIEKEIEKTQKERDDARDKAGLSAAELDKEKAKLQEIKAYLTEIRALAKDKTLGADRQNEFAMMIPGVQERLSDQRTRVSALQAEYNEIENSVERYNQQLEKANRRLNVQKEKAGDLTKQITYSKSAMAKMAQATAEADERMKQFSNRIKGLAKRVLVFSLITAALRNLRSWMSSVVKTNKQATSAIAKLKGALLTLAQPLVNAIIPIFTRIVNTVTYAVVALSRVIAALFGTTANESANAAEWLQKEQEAINGVGTAAKRAEKDLAGFDEINRLGAKVAYSSAAIAPDFNLPELPAWLDAWVAKIEAKIKDFRFLLTDNGEANGKLSWKKFLAPALGAIIGAMFGGLTGAIIGLLLGTAISIVSVGFQKGNSTKWDKTDTFTIAISAILGAALGAKFGGISGAAIGLLLGATVSIISLEFAKGNLEDWDKNDTLTVVLSAILGALLGGTFGGIKGAVIGLLLGALISFVAIKFGEGNYNEQEAIASLRIAVLAILGAILGTKFGGVAGGIIGLLMGLSIGFASVAFDDEMSAEVRAAAEKGLKVALSVLIGALIGAAFGGGVFGGIVGGTIGLLFGLNIAINDIEWKDIPQWLMKLTTPGAGKLPFAITGYTGMKTQSANFQLPALASGAVIPPNREFLAVLGDQTSGTNIETPLATMVQAFKQALAESGGGGSNRPIYLMLDGRELGRAVLEVGDQESVRVGVSLT